MEKKTDVKAIMARFQANGSTSEEPQSASAGRPKPQLHPTLSGQAEHKKKPVSEGPPGGGVSAPPKPSFLKNSPPSNSDAVVQEPNKTKALASMFASAQDKTDKPFLKHKSQSKPSFTQMPELKVPLSKLGQSTTGSDPKPAFPKPTVICPKPTWVKEDTTPPASPAAPKIPPVQLKPNNSFFKLQQQIEAKVEEMADSVNKPTLPINTTVKPSNFRTDIGVKPSVANKLPLDASNSIPPPKPHPSKKPSMKKPSPHMNNGESSTPTRNPLTNSLALGPAPAKPNRPPNVNLEMFKKKSETLSQGPGKTIAPPPPSHPGNHSNHVTPAPPAVPSLPPRHPVTLNQTEEFYDDVVGQATPPPLPPVHPSQMSKGKEESDDEDGEMYEDLDERWDAAEQKQEKRKEKDDKDEKKRLEAEKKEQREREKKEQEARKKFKLVGPLEILQKGKALVDSKGNKTDLSLKQGESLDIIRIQGNPEGKWLGRTQDGSIGYVKITSVNIDFNSLKQQTAELAYEPDLYDDIETTTTEQSKPKGGVVLPPIPGGGEDIYDDVDPSQNVSPLEPKQSPMKPKVFQWMLERGGRAPSTKVLPTPSQFSGDSDHKGGAIDEEIYDDVDTQSVPPPPPLSSIPKIDPKKQKKLEKEEKEFRKKFKFEGDIKVLHQVTIVQNLPNKKGSSKELPLKAGEKLDVIVQAVDNKFICRNEDGKFGYVSTSYIVTDDGDIYDDIGDDCIYDND